MADFEEKRTEVARLYAGMAEEELKKLTAEAWSLTEIGKEALRAELARRGLTFELVEAAPPEVQSGNLVLLRQYRDLPEALLAQGFLESSGVESFLIDETTIRMDWLWSNALGGVKLCVRPDDSEAAAQLLNQGIPENFNVEGVGAFEQPRCPQCKSLNVTFQDLNKRYAGAGILLANLPLTVHWRRWECNSCGYIWKPNDELQHTP
jgi:hypothetical protein